MSAVANERERERALYAKRALPLSLSQPPHHPPPPCSPCQQGARLRKGTHVPNCKFVLSQRERARDRNESMPDKCLGRATRGVAAGMRNAAHVQFDGECQSSRICQPLEGVDQEDKEGKEKVQNCARLQPSIALTNQANEQILIK